ncbi:SusD/RagB family nutrient-binding outer membrane lipoprotein [Dyadobacter luticola]|uniref:SusD/RagB family nutrient-binding outer membrane lipoprotein n=1 Tax=Dyadobacter luticola TaxID=1979387 RepID=A0A5R9KT48_9BACT|nr:SusD/RagB family nutrient-binding outer membrane lipoprotein [Dyadobacter luticola]TLU99451.1 SusD/RagB family nutrient-binding outer membrane lipoprotein [Dyadobacter luticola]
MSEPKNISPRNSKSGLNKFNWLVICGLLWISSACTDYMQTLNQDGKLITDEDLVQDANEGGILLPLMMNRIVATTTAVQTQQNLQAESYAGYLETPTPFLNNENTTTYFMVDGWNNAAWNTSTQNIMDQWLQMWKKGYETKYPDLYAISLIIKVAGAHRLVDTFGPYPYTQYGTAAQVTFDSEEEAYDAFFADLDKAVGYLKAAEKANPNADKTRFAKWDKSSLSGEYTNWIKLANTLKLRLAIRISKVKPDLAKTEAEKAVDPASGGLLSDIGFSVTPTTTNPYYTMANAWSDTRLSASIETFLKGFADPRLPVYALAATDKDAAGQVKGIRAGSERPDKARYQYYSLPNVSTTTAVKQIDVAESYFLKAEGALRGWNMGGTAKDFYEAGVRASFKANNVSGADEYLEGNTTQIPYTDPKNTANNLPAMTQITAKWYEAEAFETKLEKIITQKWIALYPEGTEAWSEFRRTGYPKLYPVAISKNPDLPAGTFIRRLTYPSAVTNSSGEAVRAAVAAYLGGKDSAATPIWWDVD